MISSLPIRVLIEQRSKQLGLKPAALVQRLGYQNISKGLRSLERVCCGELERHGDLMRVLPAALEVPESEVSKVIASTRAAMQAESDKKQKAEDTLYRETFQPHAVIVTEHSRPTQIFVVALLGAEQLLRIDVDLSRPRDTWLSQAVAAIPGGVPGFSKPVGVVMNYSPDEAVQFDLATGSTLRLPSAKRVGRASLTIGTKTLPTFQES